MFLLSCSNGYEDIPSPVLKDDDFTFFVSSDLHYLDTSLRDETFSPDITSISGDGKATYYSEVILDTYIKEIKEKKPDAVFFTGDNTFNGEKVSHDTLISKMKELQKYGIPTYILPGNHDVGNYSGYSFLNGEVQKVETYSSDEFKNLYSRFGYYQAEYKDSNSFSYIKEVANNTYAIMLDSNTYIERLLRLETVSWLEESLEELSKKDAKIISFSHQSILVQNETIGDTYTMVNSEKLLPLYKKYNVIANFAGHLHIQHYKYDGDFLEILSSSLSTNPCQYGIINYSKGTWDYRAKKLDISGYAKEKNISDKNLLNFSSFISTLFDRTNSYKLASFVDKDLSLNEDEKMKYKNYIYELNRAYFSGSIVSLSNGEMNAMKNYLQENNGYLREIIDDLEERNDYCQTEF